MGPASGRLGPMRSPFPGMDPWVENPAIWPDVHQGLITYSRDALQAQVGPSYFVAIGERVYVETPDSPNFYPDVSIVETGHPARERSGGQAVADDPTVLVLEAIEHREVFLEIHDSATGGRVVTVIEVLSPTNKRPGPGRELYRAKQDNVLASTSSLVEIDLLRAGEWTVAAPAKAAAASPWRVVVSPAANRLIRQFYPVRLRDRLPRIGVPLLPGAAPGGLDLQAVFEETYAKGAYARRVDYRRPPVPPLADDEASWAAEHIAQARA